MDKQDYIIRVDSERLKAIRKRSRIAQSEAAEMLGMSIGAYKSKESGKTFLKDYEKLMMRDLFHMSYDEFDKILYGGKLGEMKSNPDEEQDDLVFLLVPVSKRKLGFPESAESIPQMGDQSNAG